MTDNALMHQRSAYPMVDEPHVVDRGFLLPLGTYSDGTTRAAWPGLLAEPVMAWNSLMQRGYQPGQQDYEGVQDAFTAAGGAMTGGLMAPRPTGSIGAFGNNKLFPRHYFPKGLNPIHEVHDWAYARKLARAAMKGEDVPNILYEGQRNNGTLLAGTHRSAANEILEFMGKPQRIGADELSDVLADPTTYGLTKGDARKLKNAVIDRDPYDVDLIWDRRHDR